MMQIDDFISLHLWPGGTRTRTRTAGRIFYNPSCQVCLEHQCPVPSCCSLCPSLSPGTRSPWQPCRPTLTGWPSSTARCTGRTPSSSSPWCPRRWRPSPPSSAPRYCWPWAPLGAGGCTLHSRAALNSTAGQADTRISNLKALKLSLMILWLESREISLSWY